MNKVLVRDTAASCYFYKNDRSIVGRTDAVIGDFTGISGNVDDANLTDEYRKKGIDINDLVIIEGETK